MDALYTTSDCSILSSMFYDPCLSWKVLESLFSLLLPLFMLIITFYYYSSDPSD